MGVQMIRYRNFVILERRCNETNAELLVGNL